MKVTCRKPLRALFHFLTFENVAFSCKKKNHSVRTILKIKAALFRNKCSYASSGNL